MKFGIMCVLLTATWGSAQASSIITLGASEAGTTLERSSIVTLGEPASAAKHDGAKKQARRPGSLPTVFRGEVDVPAVSQASAKRAPAAVAATVPGNDKASPPPAPAQIPL
ncbi:hypothetical protein ABFT80_21520 [Mesorhizobium sp. SB112]|uniref:hypothetical protein n=1 Tax=Mesorhizobium sp. SB112 TaxID=3151853 RepID=UPI003264AD7F